MKEFEAGLVCWVALAPLIIAFHSHAQETSYQWPATREDRGSIIVLLEPESGIQDHTMAIMLSGEGGPIDATPWHQTSQPFIKQYLLEPGVYVVRGSADFEPTKLEAEAGRATLLELQVEQSLDGDLEYDLTVSSVENLDLYDAQSHVFDTLVAHEGAPQIYLSSLRTGDHDLRFDLEPLSEYLPLPWPVPSPAPNPLPQPSPPPPDVPQ